MCSVGFLSFYFALLCSGSYGGSKLPVRVNEAAQKISCVVFCTHSHRGHAELMNADVGAPSTGVVVKVYSSLAAKMVPLSPQRS